MTQQTQVARLARPNPVRWAMFSGLLALGSMAFVTLARAETIITAHGISTFGDLKYPADFDHLDYVDPDAPKGGEMSQWWPGGFDSLNPYSIKGRSDVLASLPYESILIGTADEIGSSYCLLCSTIEYPEDRSWVIFNLRPEVKFSDGTPMTADDVVFSYETFRDKGLSDFRRIFAQNVKSAEALDAHRVKFTFNDGVPWRDLPADVGGLSIISKADYVANARDLEENDIRPFIGTGPYSLERMNIGQTVVYRRNPDYWGKALPINKGQNNFDTIRMEYFADSAAAFEAFKAGAYTFRKENTLKIWAEQYDFPAVKSGAIKLEEIPSGAKATGQAYVFNLRREKFQDIRVRQAIGLMFNFDWTNKTLFYGLYARVNSFWENTWMAAEGAPSPEEAALLQPLVEEGLLDASILTDPPVSGAVSGDRQLDRGNLRKASKLMDEAGWAVGADGMRRNAKGEVFTLEVLSDNPSFSRINNPLVENLRALGLDAKLSEVDGAQYEDRVRPPKYDFDLVTEFARTTYFSGPELQQYYGSATADVSAFNVMGLKSPAVDRMIKVLLATRTKDDLTVATKAMDRVLRAEQFWIPQWYKAADWVASYDFYEHPATPAPYALGEFSFWWYNAEKAAALKASGALK